MDLPKILRSALSNLNKLEDFDKFLSYLKSEWYSTSSELKLALADGQAWDAIQLPGRLKLELKKILLKDTLDNEAAAVSSPSTQYVKWTKCFSKEHQHYYYFNKETSATQWEAPSESYDEDPYIKEQLGEEETTSAQFQEPVLTPHALRKAEVAAIKANFNADLSRLSLDRTSSSSASTDSPVEDFLSPCGKPTNPNGDFEDYIKAEPIQTTWAEYPTGK